MIIFDVKDHSYRLLNKIQEKLALRPVDKSLAIIVIGNDPASLKYISLKEKLCREVGISVKVLNIDENKPDAQIFQLIETTFNSSEVGGGIIQLPLPRMSLKYALDLIPSTKDLDLISSKSLQQYYSGNIKKLPPVVRSVQYLLDEYDIEIQNKSFCVVGYGSLVGKPLAYYLSKLGAKVYIMDSREVLEENMKNILESGYIPVIGYNNNQKLPYHTVILSAGVPNLVSPKNVKERTNVIDFGSSILDGKTVGDLDYSYSYSHLGVVAKSPGGLGPIVVRFLILNFLEFLE